MKNEPMTPRLSWRLAELAKATGLSLPFLRKAAASGKLRTKKIGSAVIVLDQDARDFLSMEAVNDEAQIQNVSLDATA